MRNGRRHAVEGQTNFKAATADAHFSSENYVMTIQRVDANGGRL